MLRDGDILRIDSANLAQARRDGVLMLFTTRPGKGTWTTLPLDGKKEVPIGRSPDCDLVEPLPYVSARQAKISFERGRYYLSDCGSMSGTFLNGRRLTPNEGVELHDNDIFAVVDTEFLYYEIKTGA